MVACCWPPEVLLWITHLSQPLHGRLAWRLLPVFTGLLLAQGRRTAASWWRAAGVGAAFKPFYYFLGSLGRQVEYVSSLLLRQAVAVVGTGDRLLFALDDTPTPRYGPHVEGAGVHHNPTPGPADQQFVYGHVWVTLALVVRHPLWGALGLPLRALLYVRQKNLPLLRLLYGVPFQTKLEMAATLLAWLGSWLRWTGKKVWVVCDGAYAKRPVFRAARAAQVVLVSRLRRDARLRSVPVPPRPGAPKRRGRKPLYGPDRISLAKRAAHRGGWEHTECVLYGKTVTKTTKTFLATYPPAGGLLRVVLVREEHGWVAFCCTDPTATVVAILEAYADRAAIEQVFHDLKEVHGAGQQQVRHYYANIAVYHLHLWLHTLIELWAWAKPYEEICDRSQSPWDQEARRPSHADRRKALRQQCLEQEIQAAAPAEGLTPKLRKVLDRLLGLLA